MLYKDLQKKSETDLQKILAESREKLRELRFKDANKQLKNVREIRQVRTTISRIMTLLNLDQAPAEAKAASPKTEQQPSGK